MKAILYQHPDGEGSIQFDAESYRLSLINDAEGMSASALIGPWGLRDVAAKLLALADADEAAECAGAALGSDLVQELCTLRGQSQAVALRTIHKKLQALGKLEPFDRAAGGFAVAVVSLLEVGIANLPKLEAEE